MSISSEISYFVLKLRVISIDCFPLMTAVHETHLSLLFKSLLFYLDHKHVENMDTRLNILNPEIFPNMKKKFFLTCKLPGHHNVLFQLQTCHLVYIHMALVPVSLYTLLLASCLGHAIFSVFSHLDQLSFIKSWTLNKLIFQKAQVYHAILRCEVDLASLLTWWNSYSTDADLLLPHDSQPSFHPYSHSEFCNSIEQPMKPFGLILCTWLR